MAGAEFRARDWAVALLLALAFKQFHALAGEAQLQWLLRPLAMLLNATGALTFQLQATGAWLDAEHGLAIVKACAGGNFLIASWLGWLWRWRDRPFGAALIARAVAAAWLTTLAANAVRILLIAYCQDEFALRTGLSDTDSHRLIGIGVYFASLWAQMSGSGAVLSAAALYLGVSLLLPAARAWLVDHEGIDATHAAWTAGVPLASVLAHGLWQLASRAGPRRSLPERRTGCGARPFPAWPGRRH